jgi:hypothetical protein
MIKKPRYSYRGFFDGGLIIFLKLDVLKIGHLEDGLMTEMAHAGEHHSDTMFISRGDSFVITH